MDTIFCFFWGGQERLRMAVRSNDGTKIETNRRARRLTIPVGAEIKLPGDEGVIGVVTRVVGLGGSRFAISYDPPVKAKRRRKKSQDDEMDTLLLAADAVVAEAADVLGVEGEVEIL